jgi:hypothetical protein
MMHGNRMIARQLLMAAILCTGLLAALVPVSPALAVDGVWNRIADLPGNRWGPTALNLPDGRVMVAGGYFSNYDRGAGIDIYDPTTDTWGETPYVGESVITAAVSLSDGRVVTVAHCWGFEECDGLPTLSIYDPVTDSWSPGAQPPETHVDLAVLRNDRILVVASGNRSYIYNPRLDTWRTVRNSPAERPEHLITLNNGTVLAMARGGSSSLYDPPTNAFIPTGSTHISRYSAAATMLQNGKVLLTGGDSNGAVATSELYDPATGAWTSAPSMRNSRSGHNAVTLQDGTVLVFDDSAQTERYDPATKQWTPSGEVLFPGHGQGVTVMLDGRVFVAGGSVRNDPDPSADETVIAQIFSPTPDVTAPSISTPSQAFSFSSGSDWSGAASGTMPVGFAWQAFDDGGIANYQVQIRQDLSTYVNASIAVTSDEYADEPFTMNARTTLALGHSYRLRVRATDHTGNRSPWVYGKRFTLALDEETAPGVSYTHMAQHGTEPCERRRGAARHERWPVGDIFIYWHRCRLGHNARLGARYR